MKGMFCLTKLESDVLVSGSMTGVSFPASMPVDAVSLNFHVVKIGMALSALNSSKGCGTKKKRKEEGIC